MKTFATVVLFGVLIGCMPHYFAAPPSGSTNQVINADDKECAKKAGTAAIKESAMPEYGRNMPTYRSVYIACVREKGWSVTHIGY